MARYQVQFNLDVQDIELIELALRDAIGREATAAETFTPENINREQIQNLNRVLGKLHNQKVFYSQVRVPDVPAG